MTHILRLSVDVLRDAEDDTVSHYLVLLRAMRHNNVLIASLLALSELVMRRSSCLVHYCICSENMVH